MLKSKGNALKMLKSKEIVKIEAILVDVRV